MPCILFLLMPYSWSHSQITSKLHSCSSGSRIHPWTPCCLQHVSDWAELRQPWLFSGRGRAVAAQNKNLSLIPVTFTIYDDPNFTKIRSNLKFKCKISNKKVVVSQRCVKMLIWQNTSLGNSATKIMSDSVRAKSASETVQLQQEATVHTGSVPHERCSGVVSLQNQILARSWVKQERRDSHAYFNCLHRSLWISLFSMHEIQMYLKSHLLMYN